MKEVTTIIDWDGLSDIEGAYIKIPQGLARTITTKNRKLSAATVLIGSFIFTFSVEEACRHKYDSFCNDLGVCRSTVANSLSVLVDAAMIASPSRSTYTFDTAKVSDKYFLRAPLFFFTSTFRFKGGESRPLTITEAILAALFYTRCKNDKKRSKTFSASIPDIAEELTISPRTVWKDIQSLLRAGIIYRAADEKGVNGTMKSVYHLNDKLLRQHRKKGNTTTEKKERPADQAVIAADERADRDRFYSVRRNQAQAKAERAKEKFEGEHPEYVELSKDLTTLERESAKAEVRGGDVQTIEEKIKAKRREKTAFLRRFGLTEEYFEPQYICPKCNDTGYRADGRACDCYQRE
jgi:DNA-binding Lrp family transcriptional regulator